FQLDPSNKNYSGLGIGEELLETQKPVMVNPLDKMNQKLHPFTVQMAYGMGWVIQDYRGMKLVSHAGAIDGFRIHLAMVPQEKLGIAILANLEQTRMNLALSNVLIDEYFGGTRFDWNQHLGKVMSEMGVEGKSDWDKKMVNLLKKYPGSLKLDSVVGNYYHPAYGKATIAREGKKIRFTLGKLKVDLDSLGGAMLFANDFVFDNPIFIVEKNEAGEVKAIQCTGRLEARFEKQN
ncbi:MAG: serine hydrolase, partial [Planctomycetia bacterium]